MARRKSVKALKKLSPLQIAILLIIAVAVLVAFYFLYEEEPPETPVYTNGTLQVHFLELGSWNTGDCTYIKAGETDILIDAGSEVGSISTIKAYLDKYVTDGILEYVIVTHAHKDHYAGFATNENTDSLFDLYECKTIIDFAMTNQDPTKGLYKNYLREREAEIAMGATHYTAKDCIEQDKAVFEISEGVTMTILDQKYYYEVDKSGENNYSVCTLFTCAGENILLTGDLEDKGEKSLIEKNNSLPQIDLYKAGHHGSGTSSCPELLEVIKPEMVCVCCCAGSDEYTQNKNKQFPYQEFVDNVAPYTDKVYVTTVSIDNDNRTYTSLNGDIKVIISKDGITVECSASDKKLKDTEWFKNNRTTPKAWQ